jgi:tyrosinase
MIYGRRSLSKTNQLAFIDAIKCMKAEPPRTQATYPGSKSLYDDFIALHISMTTQIHFVVSIYLLLGHMDSVLRHG